MRKSKRLAATANESLLNEGLNLAMEWGENWLKPIQDRLSRLHPELSSRELDEINKVSQAAMRFGHETVAGLAPSKENDGFPLMADFEVAFRARYPWVSEANVSRLFSQGMYYAMK